MAKKIMALVAAIALVVCFAVSVSADTAVGVATTTTYVTGTDDVAVRVVVSGTSITEGTNVTYYATKGATDVHIDQAKATASGATFEFHTAATNLDSTVKVGYTGASAATDSDITGYTVTYPGGSKVVPTTGSATVEFNYTASNSDMMFADVAVDGTAVVASATESNGKVTVIFTSISSDVSLTVTEQEIPAGTPTSTVEAIEAAAVVVKLATDSETYNGGIKLDGVVEVEGNDEVTKPMDHQDTINANANKENDRKLTVIGKVVDAVEYGIIISEGTIPTGAMRAATFGTLNSFAGATKNDEGYFAIQLIDTSALDSADAFVKPNTAYNTAVYAKDSNGIYNVVAGATVTAN